MRSRCPDQKHVMGLRPGALPWRAVPRRRRVYFVRRLKVREAWCLAVAIISTFKLLACVFICYCAPCCSFLVVAQERAYCVNRAGVDKAAHPKLLRVSGGGERE